MWMKNFEKRMFQKIILILFCVNLISVKGDSSESFTNARQIKIGAIFYEEEIDLDTYFKNAIEFVNNKLFESSGIELESIIRYPISSDDNSVILQQIVCELLEDGVVAIFGPSSKASSDIVASICHHFGIPHILFDLKNEEPVEAKRQKLMTLNIYPDLMVLSKALADVIHSYSWKTFSVIYETDKGLTKLQDIFHLLPLNFNSITVFQVTTEDDFYSVLKNIKHITEKRVIIDCNPEYSMKFLKIAKEFNMTDIIYSYFFTNLDASTVSLDEFRDIKANTTGIRLKLEGDLDEDQKSQKTIVRTIHDGVLLFSYALKSALKRFHVNIMKTDVDCSSSAPWGFGEYILKLMKDIAVKEEEEFITNSINFNDYGERTKFELEIYDVRHDNGWLHWDPHNSVTRIIYPNNSQSILSQSSLKGNRIIVSTRLGEPYLMEVEPKDGVILQGNAKYRGFSLDLIAELAKRIGFEFEMRLAPDGKHGKYDPEIKDWNGIIKELRDGKAHLGICDFTITHERKTAVEFTAPFMSLGVAILYYKIQAPPPNLFSFLDPFALEVWLYVATAYLLVSLLLLAIARISRDEWTNPHPCNQNPEELENIWTLTNATWLSMGSIMTQGCDILPRSGSVRLITSMWWFFALMMMNSYTANLAAFLTQSQMASTIEDIKDLPEQNKIKYGTMLEGSTYNFFKDSNDSLYSKMWNTMKNEKPSVFTKDNDEGVKRVLTSKGKYAFLMETTSLEYNLAKHCDLQQVGKKFSDKHYGIAMPMAHYAGVSYRSELNVEILKMGEEGVLKQLKDKWWNRTEPPCEKPHASSDGTDLSIAEVGGVFLVLGAGLFSAFVLGIAEFLWNVQRVAVEEKMTPIEAFKSEAIFALKFWINRKRVKRSSNGSASRSSRDKSESRSSPSDHGELNNKKEATQSLKSSKVGSSNHR